MYKRFLFNSLNAIFAKFNYKLLSNESFPYGDLTTFCEAIKARGFNPAHILDVGANKGNWSREVHNIFPNAAFTLVEPQIEMQPYIEDFLKKSKNSRWLNAGAGATEGTLRFSVAPDTVSSSFKISEEDAKKYGLEQREVPVITLDSITETISAIPDMVKLDVEGFEYEVLEGAKKLLGKAEIILMELSFLGEYSNSPHPHELISMMADFGYRIYDFTHFQSRPYDGALGQCELAFALESGVLRKHLLWN